MAEDWHKKAQIALEKAKEQIHKRREETITQAEQNNEEGSSSPSRENDDEREMLGKLCQILEKSINEQEKLEEEKAAKRAQTYLAHYGTWTGGGNPKLAAAMLLRKMPKKQSGSMETKMDEIVLGMDAIQEEPKEEYLTNEEPWRGSCKFSDIMEGMQTKGIDEEQKYAEEEEMVDYDKEPTAIHVILQLTLFFTTFGYLLLGAKIFRLIDPAIGEKVFPKAFVWTFQLATTIGWGDSKATNGWSQAFTVFYIIFAIPMIFAVFANWGRMATEFACIGWPRVKSWILRRPFVRDNHRLPLLSAINFLCFHQSIGIFIYSYWLKQWPVMGTVYYSITTMATIGFGDYHPDTDHWGETIVALLYLATGITLLSMLFLTIAFHFQTIHYEILKNLVERIYKSVQRKWHAIKKKKEEEKEAKGKSNQIYNIKTV